LNSKAVQQELVSLLPNMRAFAISLCGEIDRADDLVQEALLKAWRHLDSYTEGTNLRAWLFTILRNTFLSDIRRRRDEISLDADYNVGYLAAVPPEQHGRLDGQDMQKALLRLTPGQRSAIVLVGAEGFTYEEAAEVCGCAVGTIKSRVNRARNRLLELLDEDAPAPLNADAGAACKRRPHRRSEPLRDEFISPRDVVSRYSRAFVSIASGSFQMSSHHNSHDDHKLGAPFAFLVNASPQT
jgi:RNA polymerase sigma-70 factor, ECF subfamily